MKLFNYQEFLSESLVQNTETYIPTYEDCVEMCNQPQKVFYEVKRQVDGYDVSIFDYRLAQYKDFENPIPSKPHIKGYELRGLTFVFNKDGSLFKRFLLLEKFFNMNQVPSSMYSVVKNYKIKFVNNKEDGSIASFVQLPNGNIVGKSKLSFDNDQTRGINYLYESRSDIKQFVDWCVEMDIVPIFEYVAPTNRIVLRYMKEDLILLRMRDNKTGKHLDIRNYLDKIGTIKIAPFEDDFKNLDDLIEVNAKSVDKEGVIVQAVDDKGKDYFFKLKTPWYVALHGLFTEDVHKEHIIIENILDDKIDDLLGAIPEEAKEVRSRIEKIVNVVKDVIDHKVEELNKSYQNYLDCGSNMKTYALKWQKRDPNFPYIVSMIRGKDAVTLAKDWVRKSTYRLEMARDFLSNINSDLVR